MALSTVKETLSLKQEDDLVDNAANRLLGDIDSEVSVLRSLIRVINTSEALDLTGTGLGVDTALVGLLTVLQRSVDVDQEEGTVLGHGLTSGLPRVLVGGNGGSDDSSTGLGQLAGNEGDTLNVGVAVLTAEAQLGRELVADSVTEEERDSTTALLVQGDLQSTSDGVLAGVLVTGKEDGETLGVARGAGFTQDLNNFGVREPLGDVGTGAEAVAQFGTGDVQSLHTGRNLILRLVLIGVGQVGDLLELDNLNTQLVLVLLDGVLSVVRAVELLALGILTGTGVVTANDEVGSTVVLTDDGVPDGLTGTTHTHGKAEQTKDGHSVGVAGQEGLVSTDTGEVVNVTGLGETDNGVDQDISRASTSRTDGQLTVSSVHGVSAVDR